MNRHSTFELFITPNEQKKTTQESLLATNWDTRPSIPRDYDSEVFLLLLPLLLRTIFQDKNTSKKAIINWNRIIIWKSKQEATREIQRTKKKITQIEWKISDVAQKLLCEAAEKETTTKKITLQIFFHDSHVFTLTCLRTIKIIII